jgi:hypothetical protein
MRERDISDLASRIFCNRIPNKTRNPSLAPFARVTPAWLRLGLYPPWLTLLFSSSSYLFGHLPVIALHPDGFPILKPDDANMVRVGRIGTKTQYVSRIDIHGSADRGVDKLDND